MSDDKKRDRALQRRVRERQAKTGESYQAAWRQLTGNDAPADDDGEQDLGDLVMDHSAQLARINAQMFDGTIRVLGEQNKNLHEQVMKLTSEMARLSDALKEAEEARIETDDSPSASSEKLSNGRRILPLSAQAAIPPHQPTRVTARATEGAVNIENIMISNAGTSGGSADWVVNDIEIDGRSQLAHKDLPGALFGFSGAAGSARRAMTTLSLEGFDPVERNHELALVVTYIGLNPEGCPFFGAAVGSRPPQRPTILPVTSKEPLRPTVKTTITARVQGASFQVHRLEIEDSDTAGGPADWIVEDLRINGKTQFAQPGPIPGDLFATTAVGTFVKLETCAAGNAIEIDMNYIGLNPQGAIFAARFEGTVMRDDYTVAPPDLHAVVETSGQEPAEGVVGRCNWRAPATDNCTR